MRSWTIRLVIGAVFLAGLAFLSKEMQASIMDYPIRIVVECGIYIILAVSLNLINGITGQFSIGHAGFYAIGAYVAASWTVLWQPLLVHRLPFLTLGTVSGDVLNLIIALTAGSIAAAIAGFVVGLPSLRLRGDYLAIVTLGFGEVIRVMLLNIDAVGGARGLSGIPTLVKRFDLSLFWVALFVVVALLVSRNLLKSVRGLTWLAVREDEIAADAMGVDTTRVKVTAFVIGAAFAGIAGGLYAHYFNDISPDVFGMDTSIVVTTMVVLGGSGSITGSVIAAILLTALPELLRPLQDYRLVIFSTILIVMMLTRPQGILGTREFSWDGLRRLFGPRARVEEGM